MPPAAAMRSQKAPAWCESEGKGSKAADRSPACCGSRRCIREEMPSNAHLVLARRRRRKEHTSRRAVSSGTRHRAATSRARIKSQLAPGSLAGRAEGEARAAKERLLQIGAERGLDDCDDCDVARLVASFVTRCVLRFHRRSLKSGPIAAVTEKSHVRVAKS